MGFDSDRDVAKENRFVCGMPSVILKRFVEYRLGTA